MNTLITVTKHVEAKTLLVSAGVRYWEDATVNGVEDEHDYIIMKVDGSGKIANWKPTLRDFEKED